MSWLPPVVTVNPAAEPVTIEEARAQCHIDGTDFDTELNIYIAAARRLVEDYCGLKLITQTVVLRASCFGDLHYLPVAPISAVASITYLDSAGDEQTLSTDVYEAVLVGIEPAIRLKINQSWPSYRAVSDAVRVTCTAGFGAALTNQEAPLKQAMLLAIENWNESRAVGSLPDGSVSLLANYRRF